jgi:hypothetical protein
MRIKNAKPYKFPNALHVQFVLDVSGLINKFNQIMLKIIDLFGVFNGCIEKEDSYFKIVRKSNLSDMKKESDKNRDSVLVGIKHLIKAGIRHFDKDIREAAQRLKTVFDTYDKPVPIIRMRYDEETTAINDLIQELNNQYADDVQKVKLTTWIEELQIKNNEFENLAKTHQLELSGKSLFRFVDLRKETDKAYQEMVTFINALVLIDKETSYDQFVDELNTLIQRYKELYNQYLEQSIKA